MKKNLNEEISRIKTLLNIKENNLILEANPILSIIRRLAPSVESRFITGIETRLGKKIASATDTEVTTALKHTSMASVRMEIAEAIYLVEKNSIDNILSKYNMSVPGEASRAYSELSAKGYNSAILKDIKNVYNAGKTSGAAGGSSAGGKVTTTAANIAIDVEGYITKYFPNITSDKNVYNSLVNDIKPNLLNKDTKGQIDFITNKCTSLEKQIGDSLQNLTDMDKKESVEAMKKSLSVIQSIKKGLKKYGPVSFSRTDKVNWWSTIPRSLGFIAATDILVGGYVESRKTGENLADTMFKRAGERGSYVFGLFTNAAFGKPKEDGTSSQEPQKEKIDY